MVHAAVKSYDQSIWTNSGSYVLLISFLASPLDACVCISICVCVSIPLCISPPTLQSSTRRSAKVSSSTADKGGQTASKQNYFWPILKSFVYECLNFFEGARRVESRAQLQAFEMFSKAMHFCVA